MDDIEISEDLTITKYFALHLKKDNTIVIGDLHLGFEDYLSHKGVFLPKIQKNKIFQTIKEIMNIYEPEKIIINGDLKHEFSKNMRQEWNEIEDLIDLITENVKLEVVRGNHDNFLMTILKNKGITLKDFIEIGNKIIVHGHKNIESDKFVIIGHEHPSIGLRDEIGYYIKFPCFLYNERKKFLVLPAMSVFSSGVDISSDNPISPFLKNKNLKDSKVYAISDDYGLFDLGKLENLQFIM